MYDRSIYAKLVLWKTTMIHYKNRKINFSQLFLSTNHFWKKWQLILIFLVILSGIGIFFFVQQNRSTKTSQLPIQTIKPSPSPTPDPTANWNIYISSNYRFNMKYPNTWTYEERYLNGTDLYFYLRDRNSAAPEVRFNIFFVPDIILEEYIKKTYLKESSLQ